MKRTARLTHLNSIPGVRKFPLQNIPNPAIDLLFVGRNKGRKAMVEAERHTVSRGFQLYARITGSDGIKLIPYQEYLSLLANSKCLLDITQDGQNGLSLRAVEAALHGKKVITTNATATDEIARFLKTAPETIAAETLNEYSPRHFLTRLLDDVVVRGYRKNKSYLS